MDNKYKWDSQLLSETVIISTLFGLFWGHISTMGSSTRVRWRSNVLRKRNDSLTCSLAHTNNTNNIWNQIWSSSLTGETLTETMTNTQCCPCAWSNVSILFIWEHKTCWHQEKGLKSWTWRRTTFCSHHSLVLMGTIAHIYRLLSVISC